MRIINHPNVVRFETSFQGMHILIFRRRMVFHRYGVL